MNLKKKAKHLSPERLIQLRRQLDSVQASFHVSREIANDPISRVMQFGDPRDQEVTALIAAVFAYGNVKQIQATLDRVFTVLGSHPAEKLRATKAETWRQTIDPQFKHRFNTANDLAILFSWIGEALRRSGTLENFFTAKASPDAPLAEMLEDFVDRLTALPVAPLVVPKSRGARFFFSRPSGKSACKRLLLFLRWMAGTGPMDLHLWKKFPREKLLIPVDTHVLRISRHLGLTRRKDNSWQTATEITETLKLLDATDPTRFDFALCHLGISQECPSRYNVQICGFCRMNTLCLTYARKKQKRSAPKSAGR